MHMNKYHMYQSQKLLSVLYVLDADLSKVLENHKVLSVALFTMNISFKFSIKTICTRFC